MCAFNEQKKKCLYEAKLQSISISAKDKHGYCILHSHDIEWKKKNNFQKSVLALAEELIANKSSKQVNLESIVFDESISSIFKLNLRSKGLILDN